MPRPLAAAELSDGALAYLCLVAALASYRLPGFIALNEPETSLHPDLVGPLARLIGRASERTPGSSKRRFRTFRILYPGYLPGRIPLDAACRPVRQLEQMCIKGLSHDDP